jgi:hypothetical protein
MAVFVWLSGQVSAEVSTKDDWNAAGRLTVEGDTWAAVFSKDEGALLVYARAGGKKLQTMKVVPLGAREAGATSLASCAAKAAEDATKGVSVQATFSTGNEQLEGTFLLAPDGGIRVQPGTGMAGLRVSGDIAHGIAPGAPLEDLTYSPDATAGRRVCLPSENVFVGLLKGENALFTCAWPAGKQRVVLAWNVAAGQPKAPHAFEIHLNGQPVFLKAFAAPGIWHEEDLSKANPEEDLASTWKRPFSATWKTQLHEGELETCFPFMSSKRSTWRPNFGAYPYPVWFQGDQTLFRLSKKVSCEGRALVYALEGNEATPLDFARKCVPNVAAVEQRRGLQRYPDDSAGLQNCDGRAWTKWMFHADLQAREQDLLREALKDFLYSIKGDKKRLEQYPPFLDGLKQKVAKWRDAESGNGDVRACLDRLNDSLAPLETEFWEKMNNRKPADQLAHEIECLDRLNELVADDSPDTYAEASYLLDELQLWSLIEAIPARVGGLMRVLHRDAGYGCAQAPEAAKYAEEIRHDIREFLIHDETHETVY